MVVPAGRSNSMRQLATALPVPLVTVGCTSWPFPQSELRLKATVRLPALKAWMAGTRASTVAVTTPAMSPRRRRTGLDMGDPSVGGVQPERDADPLDTR